MHDSKLFDPVTQASRVIWDGIKPIREFDLKQYLIDNKYMSASFSASIIIHIVFFSLLFFLLKQNVKPAFLDQLMSVTIEPQQTAPADTVSPNEIATTDQQESPKQETPRTEQTAIDNQPTPTIVEPEPIADVQTEPLESATHTESTLDTVTKPVSNASSSATTIEEINEPLAPAPSATTFAPVTEPAQLNVLTTTEAATQVVTAPITHVAQSELVLDTTQLIEETLLEKKVLEWATNSLAQNQETQSITWTENGQEFHATFRPVKAQSDTDLETAQIEISTHVNGEQLSTEMQLHRLAFSNFGQFINRSDRDVQIHNDIYDGRFHSNTRMILAYSKKVKPQFLGKVTTSAKGVTLLNSNNRSSGSQKIRNEIFQGGFEDRIKKIPLPKTFVPFPDHGSIEAHQVHRFSQDTSIVFHEDASFSWQSKNGETNRKSLPEQSMYLIAEGKAKLTVSGRVQGKVLVYSPEKIAIAGNLTYAGDADSSNQRDFLGLVSDKYVEVSSPAITGGGDLSIHAAIYAGKRFSVRRYAYRQQSLLSIFGSLTVGSMSPTEPRFRTRITFDPRLENVRPPGFPMTERYELSSWDTKWRVVPPSD